MKSHCLGNLGGLGVAVLEVKDLHPLLPRVGECIGECLIGRSLIRKDLQIMTWTGEKDVTHLVKITLSGYYFSEAVVSPDQRGLTVSPGPEEEPPPLQD